MDIEDVAMVVNWDMPEEPEEYTHRVGRTARAGRDGVSVSFVGERDEERVHKIEDRISESELIIIVFWRLGSGNTGVIDHLQTETTLSEMDLPESKVLEKLNVVSTAKRLANMVSAYRVFYQGSSDYFYFVGHVCVRWSFAGAA